MSSFTTDKIRNIGTFGHGHHGKTMLTEAMLHSMGVTTRLGKIEEGNTVSDYRKLEAERQMSISASLLRGTYKNHAFNIVDLPGFSDFVGEIVAGMRAVDMGMFAVDGTHGHDTGHLTSFAMAENLNLPRFFVITKLDREHTKWQEVMEGLTEEFGKRVQALDFPVNPGPGFDTIASALRMKAYKFATDGSGKFEELELTGDVKTRAEELRSRLMDAAAEGDDAVLESYLETGELTPEQFEKGLAMGIATGKLIPVLSGSGTTNVGVSRVLDFLITFGPSPLNRPPVKGIGANGEEITIKASESEPTCGLVFKTVAEAHVGEMSFVRVFSGKIEQGVELINSSSDASEKIGQIFHINGKNRDNTTTLVAGDIGAMVKLKHTHTGDTLCEKSRKVKLPPIEFPAPVLETAVVPKVKGDEDKVATGLHALHQEDPSFIMIHDAELSQLILKGHGDLHFNYILSKLQERAHVEVDLIEPKIPYRETIRGSAEAEGKHKKQSGGRGQYGFVIVKIESKPRGEGYEFVDEIVGGAIPGKFIPAVDKGIQETIGRGVIAGYPVVDFRVRLIDGKYHDVDSSELAFKIAGRLGFKSAFKKCKPLILEPIYELTVKVPEEYMGDVMGDLSSRRGKILGMDGEGRYQVIKAKVPQKELYRYATTLRSMTQGRGVASQAFSHYEELPMELQEKLVAEYVEEQEEE